MFGSVLVDVERRRQVEDRLTVLDRYHPPGRERPPVTDAVDLVEDGHLGVARAQEVGLKGVDLAGGHRSPGRHEGLGRHLAAEDPLTLQLDARPAEQHGDPRGPRRRLRRRALDRALQRAGGDRSFLQHASLDGLEIEQMDQQVEGFAHRDMLAAADHGWVSLSQPQLSGPAHAERVGRRPRPLG